MQARAMGVAKGATHRHTANRLIFVIDDVDESLQPYSTHSVLPHFSTV